MVNLTGNVYGKSVQIPRRGMPGEVHCDNIDLQKDMEEKGYGIPGYRELDPSKYDMFINSMKSTPSTYEDLIQGQLCSYVFNLYNLPDNAPVYRSGHEVAPPDPNIIVNSGGGKTEVIDPETFYWGYDTETTQNSLHRHFFTTDLNFIYEAAEEYAKIESYQDYRYDPTDSTDFISSLLDFMDDGKYTAEEYTILQSDIKGVARELAERMKNGESTDLTSVESTITIKGAQFTMAEVIELQELGKAFEKFAPIPALDQSDYAKLGLAKTMGSLIANKYADKSQEFSSALETAFHRTVNYYYEKIQYDNTSNPKATYNIYRANNGEHVTNMFSSLDISSKEALEKSYQEQRENFSRLLDEYTIYMGCQSASKAANLSKTDASFQQLINLLY